MCVRIINVCFLHNVCKDDTLNKFLDFIKKKYNNACVMQISSPYEDLHMRLNYQISEINLKESCILFIISESAVLSQSLSVITDYSFIAINCEYYRDNVCIYYVSQVNMALTDMLGDLTIVLYGSDYVGKYVLCNALGEPLHIFDETKPTFGLFNSNRTIGRSFDFGFGIGFACLRPWSTIKFTNRIKLGHYLSQTLKINDYIIKPSPYLYQINHVNVDNDDCILVRTKTRQGLISHYPRSKFIITYKKYIPTQHAVRRNNEMYSIQSNPADEQKNRYDVDLNQDYLQHVKDMERYFNDLFTGKNKGFIEIPAWIKIIKFNLIRERLPVYLDSRGIYYAVVKGNKDNIQVSVQALMPHYVGGELCIMSNSVSLDGLLICIEKKVQDVKEYHIKFDLSVSEITVNKVKDDFVKQLCINNYDKHFMYSNVQTCTDKEVMDLMQITSINCDIVDNGFNSALKDAVQLEIFGQIIYYDNISYVSSYFQTVSVMSCIKNKYCNIIIPCYLNGNLLKDIIYPIISVNNYIHYLDANKLSFGTLNKDLNQNNYTQLCIILKVKTKKVLPFMFQLIKDKYISYGMISTKVYYNVEESSNVIDCLYYKTNRVSLKQFQSGLSNIVEKIGACSIIPEEKKDIEDEHEIALDKLKLSGKLSLIFGIESCILMNMNLTKQTLEEIVIKIKKLFDLCCYYKDNLFNFTEITNEWFIHKQRYNIIDSCKMYLGEHKWSRIKNQYYLFVDANYTDIFLCGYFNEWIMIDCTDGIVSQVKDLKFNDIMYVIEFSQGLQVTALSKEVCLDLIRQVMTVESEPTPVPIQYDFESEDEWHISDTE